MPSFKLLDFIEWFILFSEIGPVMCIIVMEIEFLDFTVCIPSHYRKFSKATPSLCKIEFTVRYTRQIPALILSKYIGFMH